MITGLSPGANRANEMLPADQERRQVICPAEVMSLDDVLRAGARRGVVDLSLPDIARICT